MFSGLIFIIAWLLWNNRNARWVRDKVMSHSTLMHRGMDLQPQCQAAKWVLKLRIEGWSLSCCGFCCKCSLKCCWAWLFSFMVLYFLYQVGFLVIATSSWLCFWGTWFNYKQMFAIRIDYLETKTIFIHGTEFVTWNRICLYNQWFFFLYSKPSIDQGFTW